MPDDRSQWDRIEPHTRSDQLEEGLQARVADPLWLLGRQWQLGEFRGEDAATPIHASLEAGWRPLETFRNDASRGLEIESFPSGIPLEARAEAEPMQRNPGGLMLAAEAGLQFLRRLGAVDLEPLRSDFRRAFPLQVDEKMLTGLPERVKHRLALLARRAIDGRALYEASNEQLARLARSEGERTTLGVILGRWREEYAGRFEEPGPSGDTWVPERLEHRFSVATASQQGEVSLAASEYVGGRLDWYSFDVASGPGSSHGLGKARLRSRTAQLLPVPLAYPGMPSSRWWEFEEGSVYFGAIEGGPADIARLCVAEYATVYSDDWFLIPLRLPVGSLARVTRLRVIDTFGASHRVLPVAFNDQRHADRPTGRGARPWAYFELSGDPSPLIEIEGSPTVEQESRLAPWLFLPPVVVSTLSGKPLEQVGFIRDEGANLAWAIEASIEGPTGHPLRRRHLWALANPPDAKPAREDGADTEPNAESWRYRLQTRVPPYWIPLVPERAHEGSKDMRLRRARMLAWDDISERWAKGAKGQLLAPHRPLWFFEEEIPRGGVEVSRHWQLARGGDGELHLWMAREKRPGRGERGSGLRWDGMKR